MVVYEDLQPVLSDVEDSTEVVNLPAASQMPELICANHQRHCATEVTQIFVRKSASWGSYFHTKIFDIKTGAMQFYSHVANATGRDKIILIDGTTHTPLFSFKCHLLRFSEKFSLHRGMQNEGQFCRLVLRSGIRKIKFTAIFEDVLTGEKCHLFVTGKRWTREFRIYHGDPKENGKEIARITYHQLGHTFLFSHTEFYRLIIKPGVDVALIIGFCLILDNYITR